MKVGHVFKITDWHSGRTRVRDVMTWALIDHSDAATTTGHTHIFKQRSIFSTGLNFEGEL